MPTNKHRLTINFPDHQYAAIADLAAIRGVSKSSVVVEMLDAAVPVLERVTKVLRAAQRAPQDSLQEYAGNLEDAHRTLAPMLASLLDQLDLPIEGAGPPPSNTGVTPSDRSADSTPAKGSKRPARGVSKGGKGS